MHRRRRVHQRRRTAAVAGAATVAVAAGVAGVPALLRSSPAGEPSAGPAASATTRPAATATAQRLVPDGDRVTYVLVSVSLIGGGTREREIFATDARAKISGGVRGLAFTGNGSVRVAWSAPPADADRVPTDLTVAAFAV